MDLISIPINNGRVLSALADVFLIVFPTTMTDCAETTLKSQAALWYFPPLFLRSISWEVSDPHQYATYNEGSPTRRLVVMQLLCFVRAPGGWLVNSR